MPNENPILDQLAKLMTNAAGAAKGVRDEVATLIKTQTERLVNDLDLVPREEFEAMKAIAMNARMEVEQLHARLGKLESAISPPVKKMIHSTNNRPIRKRSPRQEYRR
jgi:BMFP domain-containing protein YqiC